KQKDLLDEEFKARKGDLLRDIENQKKAWWTERQEQADRIAEERARLQQEWAAKEAELHQKLEADHARILAAREADQAHILAERLGQKEAALVAHYQGLLEKEREALSRKTEDHLARLEREAESAKALLEQHRTGLEEQYQKSHAMMLSDLESKEKRLM